ARASERIEPSSSPLSSCERLEKFGLIAGIRLADDRVVQRATRLIGVRVVLRMVHTPDHRPEPRPPQGR
ncbi:MAG: hypothetical protein EA423_10215, partial [Phycisphaerales bacterium]